MSDYIIKITPNHKPCMVSCPGKLSLEYMQRAVEGPIEIASLCRDLRSKYPELRMIVNEEGKLFDLRTNIIASLIHEYLLDMIAGPAILVIAESEELRPLTEAEAADVRETIEKLCSIEFEEDEEE